MMPRTKIQIAVHNLAKELPELTKSQIDYANSNFFEKLCYATKSTAFCLECGSDVKVEEISRKRIVCDCCGEKLKVINTKKRTFNTEAFYFAVADLIIDGIYDFQVVRVFEFTKSHSKGNHSSVSIREVCQNWYNVDGKRIINARLLASYGSSWQSSMEIRSEGYFKSYNPIPDLYCPTSKFRADYVKKGISHKIKFITLKRAIDEVQNSETETLLKAGYYDVFAGWSSHEIRQHWNSLKICIRNKYKIKDLNLYKDLLEALRYLGKDVRNAHFVCPANLHKAHDFFIEKRNQAEIGKNIADNLKKAKERNSKFIKEKEKFFNLEMAKGKIKIAPLKSVPEFLAEGEVLSHCVFKSNYYEKKHSLVLSARIDGKPIETIEYDLKNQKIIQAYGFKNKPSKHHDEIVNLINSEAFKIRQIMTA